MNYNIFKHQFPKLPYIETLISCMYVKISVEYFVKALKDREYLTLHGSQYLSKFFNEPEFFDMAKIHLYHNLKLVNSLDKFTNKDCDTVIFNDLNIMDSIPKFISNFFSIYNPIFIINEQIKLINNDIIYNSDISNSINLIVSSLKNSNLKNKSFPNYFKLFENHYISNSNNYHKIPVIIKLKITQISNIIQKELDKEISKLIQQFLTKNIKIYTFNQYSLYLKNKHQFFNKHTEKHHNTIISNLSYYITNNEFFNYFKIKHPISPLLNEKNIIYNIPGINFIEKEYNTDVKLTFPTDIYKHRISYDFSSFNGFTATTNNMQSIQLNNLDTSFHHQLMLVSQIMNNYNSLTMQEYSENKLNSMDAEINITYNYQSDIFIMYVILTQIDILNFFLSQKTKKQKIDNTNIKNSSIKSYTIIGQTIINFIQNISIIRDTYTNFKFEGFSDNNISKGYINTVFDYCAVLACLLFEKNEMHNNKISKKYPMKLPSVNVNKKNIFFATKDNFQILFLTYSFNYNNDTIHPSIKPLIKNKLKLYNESQNHEENITKFKKTKSLKKLHLSNSQCFEHYLINSPLHDINKLICIIIKKNDINKPKKIEYFLIKLLFFYDYIDAKLFVSKFLEKEDTKKYLNKIEVQTTKDGMQKASKTFLLFFWFKFQFIIHAKASSLYIQAKKKFPNL